MRENEGEGGTTYAKSSVCSAVRWHVGGKKRELKACPGCAFVERLRADSVVCLSWQPFGASSPANRSPRGRGSGQQDGQNLECHRENSGQAARSYAERRAREVGKRVGSSA